MKVGIVGCIVTVVLCCACGRGNGPIVVDMADFGLTPSSPEGIYEKVEAAVKYCKSLDAPVVLRFKKGVYPVDFSGMEGGELSLERAFLRLDGISHFTMDGGGSTFMFSGIGGVASVIRSSDIVLKNFTIDWERPYISQATVIACARDHLDLSIDKNLYPYEIRDSHVVYLFPNGEYGVARGAFYNCFGPDGDILPGTMDNYSLPDILESEAVELEDGTIRFVGANPLDVPSGTRLTIYHTIYRTPWLSAIASEDLIVRDITVHHSVGCGLVATDVRNVTIERVDYRPSKGRVFSGLDDAFHLTNCSGLVVVKDCYVDGQGDDALNVHGRYMKATSVDGPMAHFYVSHGIPLMYEDDPVWVVDRRSMQRVDTLCVVSASQCGIDDFQVEFDREIPSDIPVDDLFFESANRYPDVLVTGNVFGRANRARGILITTPGHVVVEKNLFRSAGTAILIEGDLSYWYESGAVRDMTIRNNTFDRCHISGWGAAVIAVTPSPIPQDEKLYYHKNITIEDNEFILADSSYLYHRMVENIVFRNNRFIKQ